MTKTIQNFARYNPNFDFRRADTESVLEGDFGYASDVINWHTTVEEDGEDAVVAQYLHHTICPIGTFFNE